jgi:CRISPR-associated exonuclease Cas4
VVKGSLSSYIVNGTLVWYYYICKREVWLIAHGIEPPQENEKIVLGRLVHQEHYRKFKKELLVDNKIRIDVLESGKLIGEVKKSSRYLESAKMQLAFYLYYLEVEKGEKLEGELLIPEERKRIKVKLTSKLREEIKKAIEDIERIVREEKPPPLRKLVFCKNCAYREFCWS